ncbi:MAG TPA: glycosyltransferase family 4 protein, partial [Thermoplasmata archaeon]|nr:glycosyltransferase family 4 protein [Thermoplasmata archaeon]
VAHSGANIPLGKIISKKLKVPLISGIHVSDILNWGKKNPIQMHLREAVHHSHGIACRSPHILNWLKTRQLFPADKLFPAYSGIDESIIDFSALERKEGLPWKKGEPLVISCTASSLIKRKNTDTVIKALSTVENNWILHVIGDGEERERLVNLTKSLKLEKKVIFHGYLSHHETLNILSLSHIFAMPSHNETLGIAYLEAMARGNIVIGAANTGIDGLIENGVHGFLVSPGNVDDLKTLFENICFHFDPTYLKQILQRSFSLCQKMTSQHMAEEYIRNISEVINF